MNVINDRILTNLPDKPTGALNTSYDTVSNGRAASGVIEGSIGSVAVHVDTAINNNQNYRIPGYAEQGGPNANWKINPNGEAENIPYSGKLPNSFNDQNNLGVGASYIGKSGYTGVSVERLNNNYGIPTPEGGSINQSNNKLLNKTQFQDYNIAGVVEGSFTNPGGTKVYPTATSGTYDTSMPAYNTYIGLGGYGGGSNVTAYGRAGTQGLSGRTRWGWTAQKVDKTYEDTNANHWLPMSGSKYGGGGGGGKAGINSLNYNDIIKGQQKGAPGSHGVVIIIQE